MHNLVSLSQEVDQHANLYLEPPWFVPVAVCPALVVTKQVNRCPVLLVD